MIVIDTNALIRYFLDEQPEAAKVEKLIAQEKEIYVPDVVFAELEYVLTKFYTFDKNALEKVYIEILYSPVFKYNVYIPASFEVFKRSKLGIYDSIIAAISIMGKNKLATFDKDLSKFQGVQSYW